MSIHPPLEPPDGHRGSIAHPRAFAAITALVLVGTAVVAVVTLKHHDTPPPVQFQQAGAGASTTTASGASTTTASGASTIPGTSTTSSTTPSQGLEAAILKGYRAEQAAFYAAASRSPADPFDPALAATMTGAQLTAVRNRLTIARHQGQHLAGGTADLAPLISSFSADGSTVTLSDCLLDHSYVVDGRTGSTITPAGTKRGLEHVTMQLDAGTWKVASNMEVSVGCNPGDL